MIELKTLEEIRIYSDPYRIQILNAFHKFGRPATVKEIADKMEQVPAKVHYHVKKLESIGLLTLVDTKLINGITAKYYQAYKGSVKIKKSEIDETVHQVFQSETTKLLSNLYDENKKRFLQANQQQKPNGTITNTELQLTQEEFDELNQLILDFCKAHERKDKTEDRDMYELFFTITKLPLNALPEENK